MTEDKARVEADARNRATRTLVQGAVVAVVLAVLGALSAALIGITTEQMFSGPFWIGAGVLALQAGLTALGSYIQREIEGRRRAAHE